MANQTLDD